MIKTVAFRAVVLCVLAVPALPPTANAQVLYGAESGANSPLYIINPATGQATPVGSIGAGLSGLAVHPVTSVLYGVSAPGGPGTRNLLRIDTRTGVGTVIGSVGLGSFGIADIAFRADGTLFGWSDVVVANSDGQSATLAGAFTYVPPPTLSSISPASGRTAGGTPVMLTGTGFLAGATVTIGGVAATSVTVVSSTTLTAVTGAHAAGAVDVVVANTDGQSITLARGFTFVDPPLIAGVTISPARGPSAGGTVVTIFGHRSILGGPITFGGVAVTNVTLVTFTNTSVTFTAVIGAHAAGIVDVGFGSSDWIATLPNAFTYVDARRDLLDLNGDGTGDAFLYNVTSGAWAFQVTNPFTGGFTATASAWDAGWQVYPTRLNLDGYTDAFLYDPVRGLWVQALNHAGDGTFTYTVGNWDRNWTVVPADLDGDTLTDLFVYNVATGVWVKCLVDGRGGFANCTGGTWDPGWTVTTADLNGDRRDDFFLYNRTTGVWVEAFSQAGVGAFDYPASGQWDQGWQIITADLNGDGRTDLFLLNAAGGHVSALSRASGDFDDVSGPPWTPGWSVYPGDLDGDGTTDLFLYNAATGIWVEAFSDRAGTFNYAWGQWDPGWSIGVTDLNGDGRADLILGRADGTWVQATNTGSGTFSYLAGTWGTGWTTVLTRRFGDR